MIPRRITIMEKAFPARHRLRRRSSVSDLAKPVVPAAIGSELDPYVVGESVRVEVPLDPASMTPGALVVLEVSVRGTSNRWNGRHRVEGDEADPLVFDCPAPVLRVDDGLVATFFYDVDGRVFSEDLELTIRKGIGPSLRQPWVEGTVGGIGTDLRMDDLDGAPVHVIAQDGSFVAFDRITLIWEPSGGDSYSPIDKLVPTDKGSVAFTVPYPIANKQGSAHVHYMRYHMGADPEPSLVRTLRVVESAKPVRLPRPSVLEADSDGQINPLVHDELTVHIPEDAPLEANQPLTLHWVGSTPEGSFEIDVASARPGMDILVPATSLAFTAGQVVQVTYSVTQGGGTVMSDETILVVQPIPHDSPLLPRSTFKEADDVELDMAKVGPDRAFVNIPVYRLAANGQRYWLTLTGVDLDDQPLVITIADNAPIQGADLDPIPLGTVARSDLERFKDGSEIVLEMKLTFDHSQEEEKAIHFRRRTLIIKQADAVRFPAPSLDEADGENRIFPLTATSLTIRLPSDATIRPGDQVFVHWTEPSGIGSWDGEIKDPMGDGTLEIPLWVLAYALGETAALSYIVHRGDSSWPSDPLPVHVQPIAHWDPLLPIPAFTEASGANLNMNAFTGDANTTVETYPLALEGQPYSLQMTGVRQSGLPMTIFIASNLPMADTSLPLIPLAPAKRGDLELFSHNEQATLRLWVNFIPFGINGNVAFPLRTYRIIQVLPTHYPSPTLLEANGDRVDPLTARSLTISLPDGIKFREGDSVVATWKATLDAGSRSIPVPVPQAGATVSFPITLLGYALGEEVTISYVVTRGADRHPSEPRILSVGLIPDQSEQLPRPTVAEVTGSTIDLRLFSGDAHVVIASHYLFADDQRYWLTVTSRGGGGVETITRVVNQPIRHEHANNIPLGVLNRGTLEQLGTGRSIDIELRITLNQSHNVDEAILLRLNHLSIRGSLETLPVDG
jgi:hypothetical protein